MNFDFLKPILAQAARDILRTIGTGLLAHGVIQNGAGVEAFVGAGMTMCGLAWGWWITTGHVQAAAMLKKLTDTKTETAAVAVAKVMAPAVATGAADSAKASVVRSGALGTAKLVGLLIAASVLAAMLPGSAQAQNPIQRAAQRNDANAAKTAAPAAAQPEPKCLLIIDPLKLCGLLTGNPQDDLKRVADRIRLAGSDDMDYAIAKATAAKTPSSKVRLDCLNALRDAHNQYAGTGLKKTDGSDWIRPDPAAITAIEDIAELIDNLSPQGVLFSSCAGAAQMFKSSTLQVINAFITGSTLIVAAPIGL